MNETPTSTDSSERIVVAVDGSDSSVGALQEANRLAQALQRDLSVVSVWLPPSGYRSADSAYVFSDDDPDQGADASSEPTTSDHPSEFGRYVFPDQGDASESPESRARRTLQESVAKAFGDTMPPRLGLEVLEGRVKQVLIEMSRTASMLVVGSRGHGGFTGMLLGSVSSAVSQYAHCPVLIYHAPRDGRL